MISPRRLLLAVTTTIALAAACLLVAKATNPQLATTRRDAVGPPSRSTPVSLGEADEVLTRDIDQLIAESDSARARWGVRVMSMKNGRVVYSRNSDKPFTPASNMKIYTTAVALDILGEDYRWRTSIYALKPMDTNGLIDGDLILYGRGAPDLDSKKKESLPALVDELYQRGLRHVRGNIVGDESYLRGEMYGLGWQWNDLQWYYGAQPSALTIDENAVEVTIAPGNTPRASATVVVNPNDDYLRLTSSTTTGERDVVTSIGINRGLSNNDVHIWGEFPIGGRAFSAFLSVHNPALHAATLFRRLLIAHGIQVEGDARSRDFRVVAEDRFDPQKAVELAFIESASLAEIVRKTNKESNNLYAELILRTLGKERGLTAPDPDSQKNQTRGDDVAGAAVITKWLNVHNVDVNGIAINDGSGLSRLDLITPESAVRLLAIAAQSTWSKTFHDSLPIAGRDGTLRGRLTSVSEQIQAKTGSLTYHHSLSGYATTATGEVLVFSIICNDATGQSRPVRTIDQIGSRIAGYNPDQHKTP